MAKKLNTPSANYLIPREHRIKAIQELYDAVKNGGGGGGGSIEDLTPAQKAALNSGITADKLNELETGVSWAVQTSSQSLTESQKSTARNNIGALGTNDVPPVPSGGWAAANDLSALDVYVHSLNTTPVVVGPKPETGTEGTIYRVPGDTTYTDWMYYNGTWSALATYDAATLESQFGYYKWTGTGNAIALTTSNQDAGSPIGSYDIKTGGSFKIKMTNAATGAATLSMNGKTATPLLYNGEAVSASNTWEAGEVISVYFDGTVYQATNAQGGGGKAEKIKYDNSQSGLSAENVQGAVDEIEDDYKSQFETQETKFKQSSWQINNKATYLTTNLNFVVGKRYRIRLDIANVLNYNLGIYLAPNVSSMKGYKQIGRVSAGETYTDFIYEPPAASNYQYLYLYNNDPATTGTLQIWQFGEVALQDELAQLNNKDKILKASCGSLTNLCPDLNTSLIASNNTQKGRLYKVYNGERLWVEYSNAEYSARYAFISEYPYIGMNIGNHGWIDAKPKEIVSDVDGYLIICRTADYPSLTLYTLNNHVNYVAELDKFKASRADIKFNHKLSYDASSLSVRSSATYADGVITLASSGNAKGTVNMFNDEVLITAVIKPTSNTFNIQFGQYYADYGTLFGLRTDGTTSYLDLYAGTTLKASITLPFALANGVEYMMMIKRVTLDRSYVYLDIISDNGQRYSLNQYNNSGGTLGRMWGTLYCKAVSGTCEVKNISVYSPYKSGCKVAVVGHSFVEGYSIEGMRLQRFARLLQDVLGKEECGIFGQGGCKMADSLTLIQNYLPQYNPQYVLCCVGTNDNSMSLSAWKTWRNNVISACNTINATPVFFTIPPDQGAYEGEWNSINAFIRTCGSLYVDMDKCFVNNGSPVAARYLYDNTHPNPATHYSIYLRILQDLPQIVENVDNLQSMQEEIDLLNLVPDYIVTEPVFININTLTTQVGALGTGQKWATGAGASHKAIPVNAGDNFIIAGDTTNAWGWVTSSYNPPYNNNDPVPYVTGCDRRFSGMATIQTAPEGAAYLIVGVVNGAGTAGKWQIVKVDSYTQRNNDSFVKFKFASWNIGRFVYYNYHTTHTTSDISDADADRIALEYRQIIDKTGANIFGICEYEPKYPRYNSSGNTKDILFSCFKQAREGQRLKASFCNALFMNSPQYISMLEKVFDHTVSGSPRYYIDVLCKIGGKEVHVVETHFEWTDDSIRALQIEELIDTMSVYPYVIIAGDFNTDANTVETEMQPFIDAGYAVANGGYIGSFVTHEDNYKLDNIVAKGFAMSNIKVDENAGNYSDHWIISCDLEML